MIPNKLDISKEEEVNFNTTVRNEKQDQNESLDDLTQLEGQVQ